MTLTRPQVQHVLDFLIVCTHLQVEIDNYYYLQSRSQDHVVDVVQKRKRLLILRVPQHYNYLFLDSYSYPPTTKLKDIIQCCTFIVFSRIDGVIVSVFVSSKSLIITLLFFFASVIITQH